MTDATPVQAAERQITITRVLDAPRERVFKAWTDPDQVSKWFGPEGFDTPRDSMRSTSAKAAGSTSADGKTRMTLTDGPYADARGGGAAAGWESSFDKLERLLASCA